jgi:nucleoside-diphosphate-sugar epimerase
MIAGITGGTGLIGNALALRLQKRGDSVRVLALPIGDDFPRIPGVEYVFADMAVSAEPLPGFVGGLDVLYHCAGEVRDEGRMHAAHVTAVKNLCGAAAHRVGHWVQLSSVGIYGPQPCGVVTEETPWNPLNTYERTKAESERIVRGAAGPGAFSFSVLRPSNIFGPRMANRSLFQMIEMIDRRLFFYIGRPGASANYIPVESVVESLVLCGTMPAARNRTYNVSDHLSLEDFVGAISRHLGKTAPKLRLPERPVRALARILGRLPRFPLTPSRVDALTVRSVYSTERIRRELGFAHPLAMEDGLGRLVEDWKQRFRRERP